MNCSHIAGAELTNIGVMIQAAIDGHGMGQDQKVCLAEEIFAQRPNILASILVLPRVGVGMVELEAPGTSCW
ncbi:hypothetical protein [Variovorax boronicumulans]|uniref:hypothetical protein n=1 Tax=Variovorax boronicumulans TaxID=436515 RepID=UPI001F0B415C|nr:hypothetical protein [Variovorax boronicumulans]